MSDSPTAGSRLLHKLKASISPSTSSFLQQPGSGQAAAPSSSPPATPAAPVATAPPPAAPQPIADTPGAGTQPNPDPAAQATFEAVLAEVEQQAAQQDSQAALSEQAELDAVAQELPAEILPSDVASPIESASPIEERLIIDPGALAQSLPLAVQQPTPDELQQQQYGTSGSRKEAVEGARSNTVVEAAPSSAGVELERSAEIPPEVESYIEEVIDHAEQAPEEIVIAEESAPTAPSAPVSRTVKVLPLTKAQAEMAKRKSPTFSIRWLYEFSDKIAKIFAGGVTYRPDNG